MERYTLNPVAKTLIITAAFAKAIQDINSDEYALYIQLMADIPNLEVIRKTHKTPTNYRSKSGEVSRCNQFKNLTYENMETFMMGLPNGEVYMNEYLFLRNHAAGVQRNRYALIRRWFGEQFPYFRKNPLVYIHKQPEVVPAAEVIDLENSENAAA